MTTLMELRRFRKAEQVITVATFFGESYGPCRVVSEGFPGRDTVWLVQYEGDEDRDVILPYRHIREIV